MKSKESILNELEGMVQDIIESDEFENAPLLTDEQAVKFMEIHYEKDDKAAKGLYRQSPV